MYFIYFIASNYWTKEAIALGYKDVASLIKKSINNKQLEQLKKRDVVRWSNQDVALWLSLVGFGQYKDTFIKNDISGRNLKSLTLASLKSDLNILPLGHRSS